MTTDEWGIHLEYEDAFHHAGPRRNRRSTLFAIAWGPTPVRPAEAKTLVVRPGDRVRIGRGDLTLEDGTSLSIDGALPPDVPLGYHEFRHGTRRSRFG